MTTRVLILAPRGRDAMVAAKLLGDNGIASRICADPQDLVDRLNEGAGAVLLTEEALAAPGPLAIAEWVAGQPAWSDIPFVVLANGSRTPRTVAATQRLGDLGNVVMLERPLHAEAMLGAVRSSLKARVRQYEVRDAAALSAAQNRILELSVADAPLERTLDAIVREVEGLSDSGVIGSILLLDEAGLHLRHGAGPSLPAAYNAAVDGIQVGPMVGSCGSAVYRNAAVFVADIASDPLWADYRDLALGHGLRACWSLPIRSVQGEVLGTFAMYHREARAPVPTDLEIVDFVVRTAGIVIARARTERNLRASEARYRQIVEGAEDFAIVSLDSTGTITGWNSGAERLLGYAEGEALGASGAIFFTPEDRAALAPQQEMERAASDGRAVNERWHVHKDGSRFWGSGLTMPLAGGDSGYVKIFRDRTVEHEAEAALRESAARLTESEERLRLAVENAEIGFWDVDVVNDRLIWPPQTKAMFGISAGVPVTMDDFYGGLHPDDRAATTSAYLAAADPEVRALYDVDYRTIGKEDGIERWVAAKGRGVFDASGRCVRVAGTALDITARKRAEEALRELNTTLEARISEAIAEREEVHEALRQSQKMEAMGQLTGGVAHDFNNLLTPIVGSLDMLQRQGLGNERERRLIAGAAQSAERARVLVQRLLAFARRQPLQSVAVDIAKLVSDMGELVASTTGPQVKVVVDTAEDLPAAKADPNQLEMALLNLAVNARDAMPDGGTLRISAASETTTPGHRSRLAPGPYICLSVADTGTGMDTATLARAAEPFFSTKGIGKGTGLGLSMVHGLASQLGGALTIQSRQGVGTNVELWLPISLETAETAAPVLHHAVDADHHGVALLVDDEDLVRMSTADMLFDLGYAVIEAGSAEEALNILRTGEAIDIVVTDHLMPGMTGTELAEYVRTIQPGLPVLLISGYADPEGIDAERPRLTKPFRKDELATTLLSLHG